MKTFCLLIFISISLSCENHLDKETKIDSSSVFDTTPLKQLPLVDFINNEKIQDSTKKKFHKDSLYATTLIKVLETKKECNFQQQWLLFKKPTMNKDSLKYYTKILTEIEYRSVPWNQSCSAANIRCGIYLYSSKRDYTTGALWIAMGAKITGQETDVTIANF